MPTTLRLVALLLVVTLFALPASAMAEEAKKEGAKKEAAAEATAEDTVEDSAATGSGDNETLAVKDEVENFDLPAYPQGARISMGKMTTYTVQEEDTFLDIARHFGLGYVELRAANPGVDPWAPTPGEELVIPTFNLLPRAPQNGIVVNLGDMRMYYFRDRAQEPLTYALGIGREGLDTPLGETTIVRKADGPSWFPTDRMRKEKPFLPASVPPGPSNPLGTHAMYLGWPTFLIHGSNKPWGIGRRVSSGCMRMYPEDIVSLFGMTPIGTKVTVVDQPVLVGWLEDGLYLEANPSKIQSNEIEIEGRHTPKPVTDELRELIKAEAGEEAAKRIDWDTVEQAVRDRRGYPVLIAKKTEGRSLSLDEKNAAAEKARAEEKAEKRKEEENEKAQREKKTSADDKDRPAKWVNANN